MLLSACNPSTTGTADCVNFPDLGDQTLTKINDLPDADQTLPAIISARQAIKRCYPKMIYDWAGHNLMQKDVKADESNESYVLTYRIEGISDIAIAFRADRSGHVTKVFEYSTY